MSTRLDEITNESDIFAVRNAKLCAMRNGGVDPFSQNFGRKHTSAEAISLYKDGEDEQPVVFVGGRIVVFRLMGKASLLTKASHILWQFIIQKNLLTQLQLI